MDFCSGQKNAVMIVLKGLCHEDMTVSGQFCSEFIFNHIQNAPVRVMKKISDKSLGSNMHDNNFLVLFAVLKH